MDFLIACVDTFDSFHLCHLQICKRARALGDELIVGVSKDALKFSKKQRNPICCQASRAETAGALKML
jgi:glycerol-3-phosphate cytidylyltransferase